MKKNRYKSLLALALTALILSASLPAVTAANETAPENLAPIAENLEICTFRGVSVNGALVAVDPEGDPVTFAVTTKPRKGELKVEQDGTFVYTPFDGKKGKDYFGYKAIDSNGNFSQEATVIITITKQKTPFTYSDLTGDGIHYAALLLAENGIFTGKSLGGNYIFEKNRIVTRGEFLAMCLKLAEVKVISAVQMTGFSDDSEIPVWVKPYVTTALMTGVISGYGGDISEKVFRSEFPITLSESAVILNRVLSITDVQSVSGLTDEEAVPVWAAQAAANLAACKVIPTGFSSYYKVLTMSDAATILAGASRLLDEKN